MRHTFLLVPLVLVAPPASAFDAVFSGSAAADYRYVSGPRVASNPSPLGIDGLTLEVAQKITADVTRGVSFTVKACAGCHGVEVDQAYGEAHFKRVLNLRLGRINVPFGEFTVRHDPTNFSTPSKPLPYAMGDMLDYSRQGLNLGVVPAPWVDNGAEVFGSLTLSEHIQLDYTAYVIKGLGGSNDFDFAESRAFVDNNRTPAFGGRLVLTGENWALGGSGSGGLYDAADKLWYVMAGVDAYLRLGAVTLRAEGLWRRTDLDPTVRYSFVLLDPWFTKAGFYAQLDWELRDGLSLVLRSDGLWRLGMPLPEMTVQSTSQHTLRQTAAVLWRVGGNFALKADYELWVSVGGSAPLRHVARFGLVAGY